MARNQLPPAAAQADRCALDVGSSAGHLEWVQRLHSAYINDRMPQLGWAIICESLI